MEVKDATQIVGSFGGIAEISAITGGGQAAPLSMLPYPMPIIEKAIETYMESLIKEKQYNEKARAYLKTGYTMLSVFVADEKAETVKNGQKAIEQTMAEESGGKGPAGASDREMDAAWDDYNASISILESIQADMTERQEKINEIEMNFLLEAAGCTPKKVAT